MTPTGLEIWLVGTPAELDAAARVLAGIGRVVYHAARVPLSGVDSGRCRAYARLHVPTPTTGPTPVEPEAKNATLIDLETARRSRRPA